MKRPVFSTELQKALISQLCEFVDYKISHEHDRFEYDDAQELKQDLTEQVQIVFNSMFGTVGKGGAA